MYCSAIYIFLYDKLNDGGGCGYILFPGVIISNYLYFMVVVVWYSRVTRTLFLVSLGTENFGGTLKTIFYIK